MRRCSGHHNFRLHNCEGSSLNLRSSRCTPFFRTDRFSLNVIVASIALSCQSSPTCAAEDLVSEASHTWAPQNRVSLVIHLRRKWYGYSKRSVVVFSPYSSGLRHGLLALPLFSLCLSLSHRSEQCILAQRGRCKGPLFHKPLLWFYNASALWPKSAKVIYDVNV